MKMGRSLYYYVPVFLTVVWGREVCWGVAGLDCFNLIDLILKFVVFKICFFNKCSRPYSNYSLNVEIFFYAFYLGTTTILVNLGHCVRLDHLAKPLTYVQMHSNAVQRYYIQVSYLSKQPSRLPSLSL